jgi:hypothetical protein
MGMIFIFTPIKKRKRELDCATPTARGINAFTPFIPIKG